MSALEINLLLAASVLVMLGLRQYMVVVLGVVSVGLYYFYSNGEYLNTILDAWQNANNQIFLSIPLFMLAGNLMSHGSIATRLVRVMRALTSPIPGGLALAAVASCAVFAAICGSSTVTMLAVGGVLYPAMLKAGYDKKFSIGLLMAGGTLGIIIPPSIPMILYGIMTNTSITDLFKAGILPGIFLALLLAAYSVFMNRHMKGVPWDAREILVSFKDGIWALLVPVIILGGIYTGWFTATESAVVAVVYALLIDSLMYKNLNFKQIVRITSDTVQMSGALFPMLIMAVSLNVFLSAKHVPEMLVGMITGHFTSQASFLIASNFVLMLVGCLMDIGSAILIFAPILTPVAVKLGMDPVHFGLIMMVNLELHYLTPPMGMNLLVAANVYKEDYGLLCRAAIPFIGLMFVGLVVVVLFPQLSLALVK